MKALQLALLGLVLVLAGFGLSHFIIEMFNVPPIVGIVYFFMVLFALAIFRRAINKSEN